MKWRKIGECQENGENSDETRGTTMKKNFGARFRAINESWDPKFDDQPVNQWGEKWEML